MTDTTNQHSGTPGAPVPHWVAGTQHPIAQPQQQGAAEQQWLHARQANPAQAGGQVVGHAGTQPETQAAPPTGVPAGGHEAAGQAQAVTKGGKADGRPSGLVLAGAGSLLAVLAFLGGTAVGHAWGSSGGTGQTQFNGPGGGGFQQFPGQGTGQGTQPGQGTGQGTLPNQGTQQGQGTVPNQGTQQGQGTVPNQGTQQGQTTTN
jgi:hypothetical protein